jgi:spermidine synthase
MWAMYALLGMALLSAATLLLQVALTRVFSVAQFYHFAFLVVSLALLGFGASGTLLALWPDLRKRRLHPWYALAFALAAVLGYLFNNHYAFDSYSIAWDPSQVALLIADLLSLALPFVFAGLLIGGMLAAAAQDAGRIYGANLLGSAAGAIFGLVAMTWLSSAQAVLLCAVFGGLAGIVLALERSRAARIACAAGTGAAIVLLVLFPPAFEVQTSPYKTLSQFRLNPDAEIVRTDENAYTRLDVVESATIHSAQGLSLGYFGDLPPQVGLIIDAGNLLPVPKAEATDVGFLEHLPSAVAYSARPDADVLILGSGGGTEALTALANTTGRVTVIEPNELVHEALVTDLEEWAGLADDPRVTLIQAEIRTAVERLDETYDVVVLALTETYHPISSGAFTLNEDYTLTVEAFGSYFDRLKPDGLFVTHRWLQEPPSETVRTLATILDALDARDPPERIVAFRSFQHGTFIVKPSGYSQAEVDTLLASTGDLLYDLTLAPSMPDEMVNRYARLPEPVYHDTYVALLRAPDRGAFYADYPFDITPPTDAHPFFFHLFRWEQTSDVLENLGRRWQPFGGSGYFVLLALLAFAVTAALVFVLLPVLLRRRFRGALQSIGGMRATRILGYFTLLGLAFLLVEVSLIQRYILVLGQPTLAVATVIGALLLFAGLGSSLSRRFSWGRAMIALVVLLAVYPLLVDGLTPLLLPLPTPARILVTALLIAPVGFLMGMPFPRGIAALRDSSDVVPWAWAANGSASVISAVLAAMLALSFGFTVVLVIGAGLYLAATLIRWSPG